MTKESSDEIKQQGNEALKSGDSHAAEVLYTKAIGLDKRNHTVYSNRSKARLNLKNYHGAVGDAEKAISLSRDWGKGYFRAAEVYAETLNWDRAVVRYEAAVALERAAGNDVAILEGRLAHARTSLARQQQLVTFAVPGGAGVGAFLGLLLLVADVYSPQPHLQHWMLRLITVITAAAFGAATGGVYIYFDDLKRQSYLLEFKTAGKGGASGSAATGVGGASSSAGQSSGSEGASSTKQQRVRRKVDKKPPWVKSPTGPSKTST